MLSKAAVLSQQQGLESHPQSSCSMVLPAGKVCQHLCPRCILSTFCKLQTNESIDAAEPLYDERRDIINGTKEAPEQPDLKDDEPGWQSGRNQLWGALRTPRDVCLHLRRAVLPTAGSSSSSSCICTATSFGPASPASCQRWLLRSIHVYANSTK